jgi:Fe-S cluster biogenesis protein NfuA
MFIRTETTPNPDSMKFMPDKQLLEPGQSIDFENAMAAARSPLAKMLFRNEYVKRVFLGSNFVTVTKDEDVEWDQLKSIIFADLMEFMSSGEEVLLGEVPISDTTILEGDSEDVALIKTLIETRIRPSIQDDGGDLTYRGFIDGVVFLQLQGSCTSCPSSSVTLKNGIEKMLKHWSSSVISVVAVESEDEWDRIASGQPASVQKVSSSVPTEKTANDTLAPSTANLNALERATLVKMEEL